MTEQNKKLLETAKKYVSGDVFGRPVPVFPVKIFWDEKEQKYQKQPLIRWKELQDRFPTDDELTHWFGGRIAGVNAIGMPTGKKSGIVVIDHDQYKEAHCEHKFYSSIVVVTMNNGKQYYYNWTELIGNGQGQQGDHVDGRGDGGFVVVPSGIFQVYLNGKTENKEYKFEKVIEAMYLSSLPNDYKKWFKGSSKN